MSNKLNKQNINIIIGHLTIQGGKKSDSERPLTIGTVESVNKRYSKHLIKYYLAIYIIRLVLMTIKSIIVDHYYNIHFLKLGKLKDIV